MTRWKLDLILFCCLCHSDPYHNNFKLKITENHNFTNNQYETACGILSLLDIIYLVWHVCYDWYLKTFPFWRKNVILTSEESKSPFILLRLRLRQILHCGKSDANTNAENKSRLILCFCVCVTINRMSKLILTLTLTQSQTLRVNKALHE